MFDSDSDDDELFFFDDESDIFAAESESTEFQGFGAEEPWKVLVVDDDAEVHLVTKAVMVDYRFEGRELQFISAYSADEAREILKKEENIALILLDVVMETDHAGLDCVKFIREELENDVVRIVLRTGQPGQAPEKNVIINYDINDYKSKTELTSQKLFTIITSSLRSYSHILTINKNKQALEYLINSSKDIFKLNTLDSFGEKVIKILDGMLSIFDKKLEYSLSYLKYNSIDKKSLYEHDETEYSEKLKKQYQSIEEFAEMLMVIADATVDNTEFSFVAKDANDEVNFLFYVKWDRPLDDIYKNIFAIFQNNISMAFENILLTEETLESQKEVIMTLSEVVEQKSTRTADHIKRVTELSFTIAKLLGLKDDELDLIRQASALHDIGKIGIPDAILTKPTKLTSEEFATMKSHTTIGYEILKRSNKKILKMARVIAHEHHERWDGSGYPKALKGEAIHIYARIVALADVMDALANIRCYKDGWTMDRILETIKEGRGTHFDPKIVDIFLDNLDLFEKLLFPAEVKTA
jgi:response regulator RpfG family c-di-GMP phosphodiesterase